MSELYDTGVKYIYFDITNDNSYSSTMFFETDENTDFKELMVLIGKFSLDEFSEESPHHFRMWFD